MCPLCLSLAGWAAIGGVSVAGVGALIARRRKGSDDDDDDNNRPPDRKP
jgi:hypothetical protein